MIILLFVVFIIFTFYSPCVQFEFPVYRVVVDPGHGGKALLPKDYHGDRFDILSMRYKDIFREGAKYRQYYEHIYTYEIAVRVEKILQLTLPDGDFKKFLSGVLIHKEVNEL